MNNFSVKSRKPTKVQPDSWNNALLNQELTLRHETGGSLKPVTTDSRGQEKGVTHILQANSILI